ncbi:hypothetical protein F2Q68_00039860 [Brassica cretica]|uniref:Uncharacterized protein n=1 Tax=Brassica cretica TaxID=69181 RepID=A0A8S9MQC4_BRACR|nr:hypothetical protein F2Q68_00039860 [Brassica cretica]
MWRNEVGSWVFIDTASNIEPHERSCVSPHASSYMRGDTWAHTCREACPRHMQGDTPTSTCPSAWTAFMRCDTSPSACQSACVVCRFCDTSSYDLSSCMFSTHARLHLVLALTISCLVARYHVLAICVETP